MREGRRLTVGAVGAVGAVNRLNRLNRLAAILLVSCGGRSVTPAIDPTVTPLSPPTPIGQVFILESWGASPNDTVVTWLASDQRVIVLRRAPPDNNLFGRLVFPAGSMVPRQGDSATVRVSLTPGLYGVDITTQDSVKDGAQIIFSYAIHFVAPAAAREVYGSEIRFERFLGVGRLEPDSMLVFLDSYRPGSDMLTSPFKGSGRYLVAAPRSPPGFRAISF